MTETVEAEIVHYEPRGMLVPLVQPSQAMAAHSAAVEFINQVLEDGIDIGSIPGTDDKKKVLLKPGAERLCGGYGLKPEFDIVESEKDHHYNVFYSLPKWVNKPKPSNHEELKAQGKGRNKKFKNDWKWQEPEVEEGNTLGLYRYVIRCRLYKGSTEVGQGVGSCSSMEAKYIRNPRDTENTVLKMAKKRALVDAVLTTLGLSDRFTQDVEDIMQNQSVYEPEPYEAPRSPVGNNVSPSERERNAGLYIARTIGWTPKMQDFQDFKAYCAEEGTDWRAVALDAEEQGIVTGEGLWRFVKEGVVPIQDAEIVEEATDPKDAGSAAADPKSTTGSAASANTQSAVTQPTQANGDGRTGIARFELLATDARAFRILCGERDADKVADDAWVAGRRTYEGLCAFARDPFEEFVEQPVMAI